MMLALRCGLGFAGMDAGDERKDGNGSVSPIFATSIGTCVGLKPDLRTCHERHPRATGALSHAEVTP